MLASRRNESPAFEDVYLTAQASIQMLVVGEIIACALRNRSVSEGLSAEVVCGFRGLLSWSAMYTVENETPKSDISASVGLRRRDVS